MAKIFWIVSVSMLLFHCSSSKPGPTASMEKLTEISQDLAMVTESLNIVNTRLTKEPKDRTLSQLRTDLVEQKKSLERRKRYYQRKI